MKILNKFNMPRRTRTLGPQLFSGVSESIAQHQEKKGHVR